jgi:hypothetical protein
MTQSIKNKFIDLLLAKLPPKGWVVEKSLNDLSDLIISTNYDEKDIDTVLNFAMCTMRVNDRCGTEIQTLHGQIDTEKLKRDINDITRSNGFLPEQEVVGNALSQALAGRDDDSSDSYSDKDNDSGDDESSRIFALVERLNRF